jgi:hypothetical protein
MTPVDPPPGVVSQFPTCDKKWWIVKDEYGYPWEVVEALSQEAALAIYAYGHPWQALDDPSRVVATDKEEYAKIVAHVFIDDRRRKRFPYSELH